MRGVIDLPSAKPPVAGVLLVPGSGKTGVRDWNMFGEYRSHFTAAGLACAVWDRAGCGDSEGEFDEYQTVEDSGEEAVVAHDAFLQQTGLPPNRVGWWGISRAGWICPFAMQHRPNAAFWISVSGGGRRDNFPYLLRTNLLLSGHSEQQTDELVRENDRAMDILRSFGTYEQYIQAVPNLSRVPFLQGLGFPWPQQVYERVRDRYALGDDPFWDKHPETTFGRKVFNALAQLRCPTLALFGERDTFVDWQDTARLYREAFAASGHLDLLTIRSFPTADHGMGQCETGTVMEMLDRARTNSWPAHVEGYFETMIHWLSVSPLRATSPALLRTNSQA